MTRWLGLALILAILTSCARRDSGTAANQAALPESMVVADSAVAGARPDGAALVVQPADAARIRAEMKKASAQVVLVNVWATWCGPCRAEFPDLVKLERDYRDRGLRVMFVSTDFGDDMTEVRQFLADHRVDYPTWIKTGDDMQFINAMNPKWTGAIPATFIYDGEGKLRVFHEGKQSYSTFEHDVLGILQSQPPVTSKEAHS